MSTRDDGQDAMLEINSDLSLMNTQMNLTQQQDIALHKKHIQALWRHVQRLEKLIQGIPEGIKIKSGSSEILVLNNGGLILSSQRMLLKTPQKQISLSI